MKLRSMILAAIALVVPIQAIAEPLCPALKAAHSIAQNDKLMTSLKTGRLDDEGGWPARRQIDGFTCVVTTGTAMGVVRGFYSCRWAGTNETAPVQGTIDAIGKCFGLTPTVERKSYATSTIFVLQPKPLIRVALNEFTSGDRLSFSLIAD